MIGKFIWRLRVFHGNVYEYFKRLKMIFMSSARGYRNHFERNKLKTKRFSIISNTCIGGVIYHDMGVQFQSPTVNIYIRPHDFVHFCENIHYYLQLPLVEEAYNQKIGYPVAMLGDIKLYCKHYFSFDDVKMSWEKRKKRIDWDHSYFIMTDRDFVPPISVTKTICACSEETIRKFNNLPFQNKVCIVQNKNYVQKYESCRQLMKGCDKNCVGIITNIIGLSGKRMYQYVKNFDYIRFINDGM